MLITNQSASPFLLPLKLLVKEPPLQIYCARYPDTPPYSWIPSMEEDDTFDNLPAVLVREPGTDAPMPTEHLRDDALPLKLKDTPSVEGKENKQIFLNEMESYDLYLEIIHKGFKHANSIHGITHLVRNALTVHKQRRATLQHAIQLQSLRAVEPDYDVMGNVVPMRPKK